MSKPKDQSQGTLPVQTELIMNLERAANELGVLDPVPSASDMVREAKDFVVGLRRREPPVGFRTIAQIFQNAGVDVKEHLLAKIAREEFGLKDKTRRKRAPRKPVPDALTAALDVSDVSVAATPADKVVVLPIVCPVEDVTDEIQFDPPESPPVTRTDLLNYP